LRANARHRARIGILGGEQLVHHAQPRAARAVLVEEPELTVGPPTVTGSAGSQPAIMSKIATAAGSRAVGTRLCSARPAASAERRDRTQISSDAFRTFGPPSAAFLKKHNYLIPRAVSVRSDLLKTSVSEPTANSSNPLRNCAVVLL